MKPILIPVVRFKENPGVDVWMETDAGAADMTALTHSIWNNDLFHDGDMRQLSKVYRLDVVNSSIDDWTENVAEEIAIMSLDRKERPHRTLRLWLNRFGLEYFNEEPGEEED